MDWLEIAIYVVCLSPIWGAVVWELWEGFVRPRLIRRQEILLTADALWTQNAMRAFETACMKEHAAWYRSDSFEQGFWRRVRKEIMRRDKARGVNFRKQ